MNNYFNLNNHNIFFRINDSNSYKVYVKENDNFIKSDISNHEDITEVLKTNNIYKYKFNNKFNFYNSKYSYLYINKLGYISFNLENNFINNLGVTELDLNSFTYGSTLFETYNNLNINLDTFYECETKNIIGNGTGLKLKFKFISAGDEHINKFIIDKSSIIIINEGEAIILMIQFL